ncbi:UNVERIFIED_CONTAM: hypothetical protein K2H54_072885 [Gekko kuhli]
MAARILSVLLLVGLLSIWAGMPTATEANERPGRCPTPQKPGHCDRKCKEDAHCPAGEKCCSNGCGRECMKVMRVHPGKCPKPTGFGLCAEMCAKDSDCRADEKCCSNGCGHNCMKAIRGAQ